MKILIASLKFSPAFISHMIAYKKALEEGGHSVDFCVDKKYKKFDEFKNKDICFADASINIIRNYDVVLVVNAAIDNIKIVLLCRMMNIKLIYIFHEPEINICRIKSESIISAIKLLVAGLSSYFVCKFCYKVLLPSKCAYSKYNDDFKGVNSNADILPLLFYDEIGDEIDYTKKKYFSYIGTASKTHAFEKYMALIKALYKQRVQIKFLIATKSNIDSYLDDDLKDMMNNNVLKVYHNKIMTNREINTHYMNSFCVWDAYSACTQSGVLGKAFMAGTPVLATRTGSFEEYVVAGKNGEFVNNNNIYEMIEKTMDIYRNISIYAINARRTYKNIFDYESNIENINNIVV